MCGCTDMAGGGIVVGVTDVILETYHCMTCWGFEHKVDGTLLKCAAGRELCFSRIENAHARPHGVKADGEN
jgi:hypothetical protein